MILTFALLHVSIIALDLRIICKHMYVCALHPHGLTIFYELNANIYQVRMFCSVDLAKVICTKEINKTFSHWIR